MVGVLCVSGRWKAGTVLVKSTEQLNTQKAVCVGPHSCHPNISLSGVKETLEVLQRKLQQANHRYNQLGEHTSSEEFK